MVLDPGLKASQNDYGENLHSGQKSTYYINFPIVPGGRKNLNSRPMLIYGREQRTVRRDWKNICPLEGSLIMSSLEKAFYTWRKQTNQYTHGYQLTT